jgi:antitoxin component of RelBE/YafQ-DinJ toxin-antitoxin module
MDTQETYIRFRVSDELKADMEKTAKAKGLTLSGWLRMVAIEAIEAAKDARNKGSE